MPQNVITKQIAFKPEPDAIARESRSVDAYADRLMDELFEDVDRVLDDNSRLPIQPVQPEVVSLKPISVPHIVLPMTMRSGLEETTDEAAIARQVALAAKKLESNRTFDRILLGAAFASLVITLGLWLASRGGIGRLETSRQPLNEGEAVADAKAQADAQFADYLQQAIDATDQKKVAQAKPQTAPVAATPTTATNLPAIPIPGAPAPNTGITQAINRVADALEQQGTRPAPTIPPAQVVILPPAVSKSAAPTPSAVAVAPASPASPTARASASPTARASASPTARASASPTARASASPTAPAAPAAPVLPASPIEIPPREAAPTPTAASEAATPKPGTAAAATSDAPGSTHTLVGILELGDRSAALFEIDGVARRIYVGESIGASGWTLGEVKNQEAVIRKGGEVRSVFVGQKF